MGRIILGLIITAIGFLFVWKTPWLVNNFGRIPWFEAKLSSFGGSWTAYKLFGIIMIIVGLLIATNLYQQAATAILSPIFKRGTLTQ
jgi:hypothetical protein